MKNILTLKTPKSDTLRGLSLRKLGWAAGGRQHNNIIRLLRTFDVETTGSKRSSKIKCHCYTCGSNFRTTSGIPPKHYAAILKTNPETNKQERFLVECATRTSRDFYPWKPVVYPTVNSATISETTFNLGDLVCFSRTVSTGVSPKLFEGKVSKIRKVADGHFIFNIHSFTFDIELEFVFTPSTLDKILKF